MKEVVVFFLMVMGVAALPLQIPKALITHEVLDWRITPQSGARGPAVGDVLAFKFSQGTHKVIEVLEKGYDACDVTSNINQFATGLIDVTLNYSGNHYFICAESGNCIQGQKLLVPVSSSATSIPHVTTPESSPSSPNSDSDFSAASFAMAALPVTFLSLVMALFY